MLHELSRTELLIGTDGLTALAKSHVAVFGVGGVGSYTIEALARSGVGVLTLVDYDDICLTNINRQIHALHSTVGRSKVEVMAERVKDISEEIVVHEIKAFYSADAREKFFVNHYDYVVDAIDVVSAKIDLLKTCLQQQIPVASAMGAGNKLDPTRLVVADISKTHTCPLARVVRHELRQAGYRTGVKAVFSTELPMTPIAGVSTCKTDCICCNHDAEYNCTLKRQIPGSISFVPSVSGLLIAGVVINDIIDPYLDHIREGKPK